MQAIGALAVLWCTGAIAQPAPLPDEFSWLDPQRDEKALAWVQEQNARTLAALEGDARFDGYYRRALAAGGEDDPNFALQVGGWTKLDHGWIYQLLKNTEHPRGLWRRTTLDALLARKPRWQTLLDVDALARQEGRQWAFSGSDISPNGRRSLVTLTRGEVTSAEIRELDLESGRFVDGGFAASGTLEAMWRSDDTVVFISATDDNGARGRSVQEWLRGRSPTQSQQIFRAEPDDQALYLNFAALDGTAPTATGNKGGSFRVVTVARVDRDGTHAWWQLDEQHQWRRMTLPSGSAPVLYGDQYVFQIKQKEWLIGGKAWKAGSVVSVSRREITRAAPQVHLVMASGDETSIWSEFVRSKDGMFLRTSSLGEDRLWRARFRHGRWKVDPISLPEHGAIFPVASDVRSSQVLIRHEGFLQPPTTYRVDSRSNQAIVLHAGKSQFDAEGLVVERLEAPSADGVRVPYFIVQPKQLALDGRTPALVEGYGASGMTFTPYYLGPLGALWVEKGGIYVVAGVRGGSERGSAWAVTGVARQHTYEDMIAVMDHLIRRKFTSARRMAIRGHSAGGLLAGVVLTQRPDLMHGALLEAAVLDQLSWRDALREAEFGSPDLPEQRAFLERTSPFQNLRKSGDFPLPFIITSTTDDGVPPKHSRRFAAKLQSLGLPFFFYEAPEGGHSMAYTPEQVARLDALRYVYLARQLMD